MHDQTKSKETDFCRLLTPDEMKDIILDELQRKCVHAQDSSIHLNECTCICNSVHVKFFTV